MSFNVWKLALYSQYLGLMDRRLLSTTFHITGMSGCLFCYFCVSVVVDKQCLIRSPLETPTDNHQKIGTKGVNLGKNKRS